MLHAKKPGKHSGFLWNTTVSEVLTKMWKFLLDATNCREALLSFHSKWPKTFLPAGFADVLSDTHAQGS